MSVRSSQEDACEELKNEFLGELQRMQIWVHGLINDLTAISGYAQLVQFRPEYRAIELPKIIHTVEKSMLMLRECIARLQELERKYVGPRQT